MNFRIGQKVAYVGSNNNIVGLIKNQIYTIKGLHKCKCAPLVDVGLDPLPLPVKCPQCGTFLSKEYGILWIFAHHFKPLIEDELEKFIEQKLEGVGYNNFTLTAHGEP